MRLTHSRETTICAKRASVQTEHLDRRVAETRVTGEQTRATAKAMMTPPLMSQATAAKTPIMYPLCSAAVVLFALLVFLTGVSALAQLVAPAVDRAKLVAAAPSAVIAELVDFTLPDSWTSAAVAYLDNSSSVDANPPDEGPDALSQAHIAPIYTKYIPADEAAQPITARDKVLIGLHDLYTPFDFSGFFIASGYGQVLNGQPNYGTDRGAFGARLGAAVIGATAQGIFADTVFAPLLHEDPRYVIEGPEYGFIHRAVYAGTRPLITRADSGRSSVNGAVLLGYAAASALSLAYYPQINRNLHDTMATFGGSIGGESLNFLAREFSSDILQKLHLVRRQ